MRNRRSRTRPATLAATLALAGIGLVACGDETDHSAAVASAPDLTAFCDGYASALQGAVTGDPAGEVEGLSRMIASGPSELAAPLQRFGDAVEADGQDVAHQELGSEAFAAIAPVAKDCDGDQLQLIAIDYGFEGVPDELPVGRHIVSLTNTSDVEEHEAVILRRTDDADLPAHELFQLPEEQVGSMIVPVAFLHAGNEGEIWVVDLEPGDYIIACFLPVGGNEEAPPHMAEGMLAEFRVRG